MKNCSLTLKTALRAGFDINVINFGNADTVGNTEIQRAVSDYNQATTTASSILKKSHDTQSGEISKI